MNATGTSLLLAFLLLLVAPGCREAAEPEAPAGSFEARVEGVLVDTLRGVAAFGAAEEGRVSVLELEVSDDTTEGLSFELEPLPPEPRIYAVRQRRPAGDVPRVDAFLDLDDLSFVASAGTLRIDVASRGRLGGSFHFRMEAPVEVPYDEPQPVTVRGRFDAAPASPTRAAE